MCVRLAYSMHAEVFSQSLQLCLQWAYQHRSVRLGFFVFSVVLPSSSLEPSNHTGLVPGEVGEGFVDVNRLGVTESWLHQHWLWLLILPDLVWSTGGVHHDAPAIGCLGP